MATGQNSLSPSGAETFSSEASEEYVGRKLGVPPAEQIFRAFLAHKWMVLAIVTACLLLGIVATLLTTPQYTAVSRIEISRQQANVTNVEGVEEADRTRDNEFYDTQYSLLQARSLAERVVRDLGLANDEEFFATFEVESDNAALLETTGDTVLTASDRAARFKEATDILLDHIEITPIRGSSLVDVGFTSPDATLSAKIANAWVEQFVASNLARRFDSTSDAREFLEEQLDSLRERLEESERQLVNYAADKGIVTFGGAESPGGETAGQETLVASDLQAANGNLARARADRIEAESALRQTNGAREALTNPTINGLRQRRALVAAERDKLLTTFEPAYPAVEALTAELQALEQSIRSEEDRFRSFARSNYNEALQREQTLQREVDQLKGRFSGQNQDSIQYNIYQREVATNRELYDGLLQRYKEIGVAGVGTNNVAVVDRAQVPRVPSSPNLLLNLALAIVFGGGLAAAYVFLREQLDQSLRDPADVKRLLGIAGLGIVPRLSDENVSESLQDPKSVASEAYFSIATSLSFLTDHGTPSSMLMTSTVPNEGKSTSAVALAHMLARTGKRTLLIDADMRNPSAHLFFDMPRVAGLSNYLSGEADPEQLIIDSGVENLAILAAGPPPPNPAELLGSNRLAQLLRPGTVPYDHIVIDGPPVLGIADSPLLASAVEGVIFTIEANSTKLRAIDTAMARLRSANANIFGAIVTKLDSRNSSYGYGETYGYGYGYGENKAA